MRLLTGELHCLLRGSTGRLVVLRIAKATLRFLMAAWVMLAMPGAHARTASTTANRNDATVWCQRLTDRLPGLSRSNCEDSALVPSGARSNNGFPILIRRYAARLNSHEAGHAAAPVRVLLLGGIHGDELTASAIVFQWMQSMQIGSAGNLYWEVVPVLNPDGLMAAKPNRVNAHGVDLNRNFPTPNWVIEAPRYWARETGNDPRRFPGNAPLSEPETRWLNEEMARFRPNVIVSVHAPYGVLDFDGPAPAPRKFGRLALNPVGVYPGSLGNYSGKFRNVPVITIELPNAVTMPSEAEAQKIWTDMLDWINRNVARRAVGASNQFER